MVQSNIEEVVDMKLWRGREVAWQPTLFVFVFVFVFEFVLVLVLEFVYDPIQHYCGDCGHEALERT